MILEVAILNIKEGLNDAFELDFAKASQYIQSIDGYLKHSLQRCVEIKHQYILLVEWENLEAHELGFRQSPQYQEWKKILHHYYSPFPSVEHYSSVYSNAQK